MSTVPSALNDDPFSDTQFGGLDLREAAEVRGAENLPNHNLLQDLTDIANENPSLVDEAEPVVPPRVNAGAAPLPPSLAAELEAAPIEDSNAPEEYEMPDGSTITIEKTNKGWKATGKVARGKNPEVFYGATQKDLLVEVMAGKLNATTKIRELNREAKLNRMEPVVNRLAPAVATPQVTQLSADDTVQLKAMLASDPAKAYDTYFQKRTGMSVDQLVQLAKDGQDAKLELQSESVSRAFMAATPEYYADEENHNYFAILSYLSKTKLGERFKPENYGSTQDKLIRNGFWTVDNLQDAFEILNDDDIFVEAENEEDEPEQVTVQPAPKPIVQTPSNPRIADVRRRARAAHGIRQAEISPSQPDENPSALSVEEQLDTMSTDDISKLMAGVRRDRMQRARR